MRTLLFRARDAAEKIINADPDLRQEEHAGLRRTLIQRFADRAGLYDVG